MLGVRGAKPAADAGANVATMSPVARVAQPGHQLGRCRSGAPDLPAGLSNRYGEAKARQRRDDKIKCVLRIAKRPDQVQAFNNRRRVAVDDQEGQGIRLRGAYVQVVDLLAVDLGGELR